MSTSSSCKSSSRRSSESPELHGLPRRQWSKPGACILLIRTPKICPADQIRKKKEFHQISYIAKLLNAAADSVQIKQVQKASAVGSNSSTLLQAVAIIRAIPEDQALCKHSSLPQHIVDQTCHSSPDKAKWWMQTCTVSTSKFISFFFLIKGIVCENSNGCFSYI